MRRLTILYCTLALLLVLGGHRGYVALFEAEKGALLKVFPYRTEYFPEEDRKLLEIGIPLQSQTELSSRMEDFTS